MSDVTKIKIDGKDLPVIPSDVQVSTEVIRNTERALDGTMCIDVVAKKLKLQIMWDLVTDETYKAIKNLFKYNGTVNVIAEDKKLFSREDYKIDGNSNDMFNCYVDSIDAQPYFIEEDLHWQSVTVTLAEV